MKTQSTKSHDDTHDKHVTITGLKAATEYTLSVVAVINIVKSLASTESTVTTSELIIFNVLTTSRYVRIKTKQ